MRQRGLDYPSPVRTTREPGIGRRCRSHCEVARDSASKHSPTKRKVPERVRVNQRVCFAYQDAWFLSGSETGGCGRSDSFDISLVHFDGEGTLDQINGEDEPAAVFSTHDDPFQALQGTTVYADFSS